LLEENFDKPRSFWKTTKRLYPKFWTKF
jgi:hypothetical protein